MSVFQALWKLLSAIANVRAVSKGPKATAKRVGRYYGHRKINRWFR